MTTERPRLADVARLAGVSTATASRALSNPDLVSKSTREAVEMAALDVGYRVNLLARSLRTQRSNTLLALFPGIDNQFYPEIISGIEAHASANGYSIIIGFTANQANREAAYVELAKANRADGMIVADDSLHRTIGRDTVFPFPAVQLLETHSEHAQGTVCVDDVAIARLAMDHLIGLGHRRIAHLSGPQHSSAAARRMAGYRAALDQAGIASNCAYVVEGAYNFESGAACIDRLLALPTPPTALFCANDASALGALWQLRQAKLPLPCAMSVIGVDGISDGKVAEPPLTTVRQPLFDLGMAAADLLIALVEGRPDVPRRVVLPHELIVRGSTAPVSYS